MTFCLTKWVLARACLGELSQLDLNQSKINKNTISFLGFISIGDAMAVSYKHNNYLKKRLNLS